MQLVPANECSSIKMIDEGLLEREHNCVRMLLWGATIPVGTSLLNEWDSSKRWDHYRPKACFEKSSSWFVLFVFTTSGGGA